MECSRMLPQGVPNAPSSAAPWPEQLNACPIIIPGSSAPNDTRSHAPGRASPLASQPGCSCTLCRDNRFVWTVHYHTSCPRRDPGLSAPKRKRCSQNPDAILTSSGCTGLSLRRSRPAVACRLRQSCRRDRGPVALPRSGCSVRCSRHPAALSKPARAPPPAAPRGILRSRSAAPPQSTPAKRRAIFNNNQSIKYQTKTPIPQDCLILRYTSDQPAKCALCARSF